VSRIARDSPGMRQNVPRPDQVHSGTMQRPRINFYRTKYVVALTILLFEKSERKIYLQHQQNMQHTLNLLHKSRAFYLVVQYCGLPKVS